MPTNPAAAPAPASSGEDAGSIAVIGMAGRFPGAPNVAALWANLRAGVESVSFATEAEVIAAGESPEVARDPAYVRARARLEGIDQFDAAFFGMSARDAAVYDPQHRVFLECAWEAFEDAGYVGEKIQGPVGVFASCGMSEYMIKNVLTNAEVVASVGEWLIRHTGNDTNFLATRVSYELDLRGPSLNVQTACSSSLVAIHLACQSLLSGECDAALAGGSTISPDQDRGYLYKDGEILSPDGHCRAFDAQSGGTLFSSASGAVLLKRLDDALRDGDRILGVIRGSAINNDGKDKVGFLAPSVSGQARVISEALAVAGVEAREISYVEAHGTGTRVGDPIEIAGLTQAFRQTTSDKQFCAIGSLKTNFGHAGEAAGICGFIKTLLALTHKELPPSLHYQAPNPHADLPDSPFFVNATLRPWNPSPGGRRLAGITGLGAGGTNVHVILEEAAAIAPPATPAKSRAVQLLTLSAKTPSALDAATRELASHLRAHPELSLADVAYTRLVGRKAFRHRRAVACQDRADAISALEAMDARRVVSGEAAREKPSLVFMFPGGGAQYPDMGRELYLREPVYRDAIDACARSIQPTLGLDFRTLLFPTKDLEAAGARLQRPSVALPALFATEYALGKLLESWGIIPAAMIGHSAGEYAAACLSGVLSMKDALALVALRGRLFETLPEGSMLSVALSEADARARLPVGLGIAAANAPSLCVVSGPTPLVDALELSFEAEEIDCARILIDVAAHSAMLEPILSEFGAFCRTIKFSAPKIPYVSNLTGTWITAAQVADPNYWVRHLRQTVRFSEGIEAILAEGNRVLLEIGPGRTLGSLGRMATKKAVAIASSIRHPKEEGSDLNVLLTTLGRLWISGVELDAALLFEGHSKRRVPLPTYPFERQRYWIEPGKPTAKASATGSMSKRADVGDWFYTPSWKRAPAPKPDAPAAGARHSWLLVQEQGQPLCDRLAARLGESGDEVVRVIAADAFAATGERSYALRLGEPGDWDSLVDALKSRGALPNRIVYAPAVGASMSRNPLEWISADAFANFEAAARSCAGLLSLVRALGMDAAARLAVLTSGVHAVHGGRPAPTDVSSALKGLLGTVFKSQLAPERALLHGAARVIPREYPNVETVAIDVELTEPGSAQQSRLIERLVRELGSPPQTDVVAFRGGERWVRAFDPIVLEHVAPSAWVRPRGVYLITGGLGGIGLEVAEHLASVAKASLVLIGRTPLPSEPSWPGWLSSHSEDDPTSIKIKRVNEIRATGSQVMIASADVADPVAMKSLVAQVKARFGAIHGVFHSAGVLRDSLIALRSSRAASEVIDVKVKGTLVLEHLLAHEPIDLFVLFSSVSSILGLPGQADYTAANAFLDAFAHKKSAEGHTRAVVVNWNAWQQVGMAVAANRAGPFVLPPERSGGSPLLDEAHDEGETVRYATRFSRKRHWLVDEHVVRGRDAVMPGTGFVQLASAAIERLNTQGRAIELRDLFFLAPFIVKPNEPRQLEVKLSRASGDLQIFSTSQAAPHVTARVALVEAPPAVRHDLAAIRARCTQRSEHFERGFSAQPFMDFGPRWGCLVRIDYGRGEALATLELPAQFASDVTTWRLHPALLDMATGSAQALIPGFSQQKDFFVPFSYGRLLSRRALPSKVLSHIRLRESGAADLAVFDIAICDEGGDEVAQIEGFVMRRVADSSKLVTEPDAGASPASLRVQPPLEASLRDGISPGEGIEALDRILGTEVAPQIVASSVGLHAWIAQVDATARAQGATAQTEAAGTGPQFSRPNLSTGFLAPTTPLEKDLAAIWRELLGLEQVGVNDDFFELGGQSLIAVRLFGRIRKKWGVELPLATLFEAPTIGRCAAILAERGVVQAQTPTAAAAASAPTPVGFKALVTIQRGGARTPFFCVHGAGGNVLNFRDLSRAMDRSQPFYGLQARGIDGLLPPHTSINEMATAYLNEVRELQPHGPYQLGGYSGGGLVAFEMAQRLTRAGEPVALVAMLDTFHPQMVVRTVTTKLRLERLREGGLDYVKMAVRGRRERHKVRQTFERIDAVVARGEPMPSELRELYLTRNFERAAAAYVPAPWAGRAILFRAAEVAYIYLDAGESYGWSNVIRGLQIIGVPGNHSNLLLEPNAGIVAHSLWSALQGELPSSLHEPARHG